MIIVVMMSCTAGAFLLSRDFMHDIRNYRKCGVEKKIGVFLFKVVKEISIHVTFVYFRKNIKSFIVDRGIYY